MKQANINFQSLKISKYINRWYLIFSIIRILLFVIYNYKMSRIVNESNQLRILVAEDDAFQRLSLIDILGFCNYDGFKF